MGNSQYSETSTLTPGFSKPLSFSFVLLNGNFRGDRSIHKSSNRFPHEKSEETKCQYFMRGKTSRLHSEFNFTGFS